MLRPFARSLTRALKGFFLRFEPAVWWTPINRYLNNGFHALAEGRFFPRFSSARRKMSAFKLFLQLYFATDLTPLHVKITRSTNLWSPCRRKLKLSTYLNTVSYNHISSLNTRWQLILVLASSGFY